MRLREIRGKTVGNIVSENEENGKPDDGVQVAYLPRRGNNA